MCSTSSTYLPSSATTARAARPTEPPVCTAPSWRASDALATAASTLVGTRSKTSARTGGDRSSPTPESFSSETFYFQNISQENIDGGSGVVSALGGRAPRTAPRRDRALSPAGAAGPGRHGRGLSRAAQGDRPAGGAEDGARARRAAALGNPPRDPRAHARRPSRRGAHPRRGRGRRRSLVRHGAPGGRHPARSLPAHLVRHRL